MTTLKDKLPLIVLVVGYGLCLGCGIKGDPQPPENPVTIGRGQPTFQNSSESLTYPELPPVQNFEKGDKVDRNYDDE